jgi:Zn-dependent metalloprotease
MSKHVGRGFVGHPSSPERRASRGACRCYILPPHILERLSQSADAKVRQAAVATSFATHALRTQRAILSAGMRPALATGKLRRTIYDAHSLPNLPGEFVMGEGAPFPNPDPAVKEAYTAAGTTYEFYREVFSRNSIDGNGLRIDSTVHFCEEPGEPFDNAFWNGEQMVYGDGDGVVFTRFTISLDVIAHELTHGVTQYEANLEYHDQPGALNESMSDVFGSMVKQWKNQDTVASADWLIGDELFIGPGALRSMKEPGKAFQNDPNLGDDPQVGTMKKYRKLPNTRSGDNGGVHINSGIPNRAFYLACVNLGAEHSWDKAGKIWYKTLVSGLSSTASFRDAAKATILAARDLYGDADGKAVQDAWRHVEVL